MKSEIQRLKRKVLFNDIVIIIFMGMLMNLAVIFNNNSKMPVLINDGEEIFTNSSPTHFPFYNFGEVNFPYFADIIRIKYWKWVSWISIGDLIMFMGIVSLLSLKSYDVYVYIKDRRNN